MRSYSATALAAYSDVIGNGPSFVVSLDYWTPAVIEAPPSTPTRSVTFTQAGGRWTIIDIPVTQDVFTAVDYFKSKGDTDSDVCLYSDDLGVFFNFWALYDTGGGSFSVGTGSIFPINGDGWWNNSLDPWSGATAGGSYCGGLIRPSEWAAGQINHALQGGWPNDLNQSSAISGWVFPATTTDGGGDSTSADLPEGALLQLDPSLTDAELLALGVPSADLPICHAMQIYGWYDNDSVGDTNNATIRFQSALGNGSSLYPGAAALPNALLSHFRVIAGPSEGSVAPLEDHDTESAYISSP